MKWQKLFQKKFPKLAVPLPRIGLLCNSERNGKGVNT